MALDTNIVGTNLDAGGNVKVALSNTAAYIGSVRIDSENDSGTLTGTPYLKSPETSLDYRLRTGIDTVLFSETFNATAQNTSNWSYIFNTLTAAQPGAGTVNFGVVQGTTNAHGALMRSYQYFPIMGTAPLSAEFSAGAFTAQIVTNEVWLMGFGNPTAATTEPTDGVWFKYTSAGWVGVIRFNGSTVESSPFFSTAQTNLGELGKYSIVMGEQEIEFWRNDLLLGKMTIPVANGQPSIQASLPIFMMKYNTGAVANTNTMRVSDLTVSMMDIASNKPWAHQMATAGQMGYIGQNGHTQGQTAWWTNNTAPTAAAATNTAAIAGATTLGGLVAVLPTLAANSDGILFSYQNPASTINITGRNLVITGVRLQGVVSVVLAGGPVTYIYGLAFGHTAVSLATAETASFATGTTHAPRRLFLGIENYALNAAVGTVGATSPITVTFNTPVVVRPGEFVAIIGRNINTVTTTGAITVGAAFDAYWE